LPVQQRLDRRVARDDRARLVRLPKTKKVDAGHGERDTRDLDDLRAWDAIDVQS